MAKGGFPGGGFGGGNMGNLMKQAQKMQAEMARVQEELKDETVEASAGGGAVRVVMSGDLQVREVYIEPSALDPDDVEMVQDMVAAAFNEALRQAQEEQKKVEAAAREQAKRDLDSAKKAEQDRARADAEKKKAEQQQAQLAAEQAKRQKAVADAEAKVKS
jgi:DNA-binding YbaB/EbfC family protein